MTKMSTNDEIITVGKNTYTIGECKDYDGDTFFTVQRNNSTSLKYFNTKEDIQYSYPNLKGMLN